MATCGWCNGALATQIWLYFCHTQRRYWNSLVRFALHSFALTHAGLNTFEVSCYTKMPIQGRGPTLDMEA